MVADIRQMMLGTWFELAADSILQTRHTIRSAILHLPSVAPELPAMNVDDPSNTHRMTDAAVVRAIAAAGLMPLVDSDAAVNEMETLFVELPNDM